MNKTIIITILAVALVGGVVYYVVNLDPAVETTTVVINPGSNNTNTNPANTSTLTPAAPIVTTDPMIIPTASTALLGGKVYPNGAATSYWFEYGTTPQGTSQTSAQIIGSGYMNIPTPAYLTGLTPDTKYYFRLVAQNALGKTFGTQYAFQTTLTNVSVQGSSPTVTTSAATSVERTTARLNGSVNPNSGTTAYWFEYGTSVNFGSTTAFQPLSGSSKNNISVSVADLVAGTKYYFRINAQNQYGTVNGSTATFTTKAPATINVDVPINGTGDGNW